MKRRLAVHVQGLAAKIEVIVVCLALAGTAGTIAVILEFSHQASKIGGQQKTINRQNSLIEHIQTALIDTTKASASTRVTTVTQRCALTLYVEDLATLNSRVLHRAIPPAAQGILSVHKFDLLASELAGSYAGCEAQLKLVEKINRKAISPAKPKTKPKA